MKSEYKHFAIIILGMILIGIVLSVNSKNIDISGEVVAINDVGQDSISIIVIGEEGAIYDKASIIINQRTLIYRGDDSTRIAYSEIEIGDKVEVIFKDAIMESYPIQVVGDAIRIRE